MVDTLTGLANRRQFDERLALALARLQRNGTPTSVMFLDIDHFKRINDTYGHAAGDEILRVFANRLLHCVRSIDLVARLGGDEFVVIIEDAAVPEAAEAVARKLIATMNQDVVIDGTAVRVTTSIGIAYTRVATDAATFMSVADAALYHAKRERNTFHIESVTAPPPGKVESSFA
jgi:diguanylate cyclase (GGDEF)-like protein